MPRKAKSDNYDALGSIFDFIFSEAKKPYGKRRSVKTGNTKPGISGEDAFTDTLAFTLERPGAIMSESVVNELDKSLDLELASVQFDEAGKLAVSTGNIINLIKDPKGFVDKAITRNKATRKASRAKFLGENIEDFVTTAWAYKFGDLEVKAATRGMIVAKNSSEAYKVKRALGQYSRTHTGEKSQILRVAIPSATYANDLDYMADRSLELLGRRTFLSDWETMSDIERDEFVEKVSMGGKQLEIQQYLERKYSPIEAGRFASATGANPNKEIDLFKPDLYKSLESQNLADRIMALSGATPGSKQEDEKRMYEKTLLLLNRNRVDLTKQLSDLNTEYRSATTSARKSELQKQIKDTKGALRSLDGSTFFGQIGKWEGYINSLKTVYGPAGTNVAASIINGEFFNEGKNKVLNPIEILKDDEGKAIKYGGVEIFVAKKLQTPNGNDRKVLNLYNKMGENLYYMTPRSLFRTFFFNGEGFARFLKNQEEKFTTFSGASSLSSIGLSTQDLFDKINSGKIGDLKNVVNDALTRSSSVLSPDQYLELEKILKSSKTLREVVHWLSLPSQAISHIKKAVDAVISDNLRKLRESIVSTLLKNQKIKEYLIKSGGIKLLGKWVSGAGLKVAIKGLVTALAAAVGLVGTPLASFVIAIGTWIGTDLVMKVVGDLLSILKYVTIGIFAFVIISGSGALSSFNKKNFSYSNAIPDSVISCTQYEETEVEPSGDIPWGPGVIPPRSSESCVFGAGAYNCSQGFVHVTGWSHEKYTVNMPVDLTNVYYVNAPQFCSTGTCTVTRIAIINCSDGSDAGGIVEFDANDGTTTYHFKLLHVVPLGVGQGDKLDGGQPVARVLNSEELKQGWCWTGMHLHLETKQNGSAVDPMELLQSFSCDVPDESGCSDPN